MRKLHLYTILVFLLWCIVSVNAQNATSSPSSRFVFGELNDNVPVAYSAMGGVSFGMRSNKVINPSQPASYTSCDSLSFMFDLAGSVMWTHYGDSYGKRNVANGNLEYVTLQFPLWKRYIAMSAGISPYSSVGYSFVLEDSVAGRHYAKAYAGVGGISQVYLGLSANLFDWVALGVNAYYMFGTIDNTTSLAFTDASVGASTMYKSLTMKGFRFRYGMQFFHTFDKHSFVLGGIFETKQKLRSEYVQYELSTMDSVALMDEGFEAPMTYGGGLSYTYDNRLALAFDYMKQNWSDVLYYNKVGTLRDRTKMSMGVEYRHNELSRNYAERMYWRVGASLIDSYVPNANGLDFSVSMGIGLPLRMSATVVNAAIEYNRRTSMVNIQENCLKLVVNVSVNENWFFKRKL